MYGIAKLPRFFRAIKFADTQVNGSLTPDRLMTNTIFQTIVDFVEIDMAQEYLERYSHTELIANGEYWASFCKWYEQKSNCKIIRSARLGEKWLNHRLRIEFNQGHRFTGETSKYHVAIEVYNWWAYEYPKLDPWNQSGCEWFSDERISVYGVGNPWPFVDQSVMDRYKREVNQLYNELEEYRSEKTFAMLDLAYKNRDIFWS